MPCFEVLEPRRVQHGLEGSSSFQPRRHSIASRRFGGKALRTVIAPCAWPPALREPRLNSPPPRGIAVCHAGLNPFRQTVALPCRLDLDARVTLRPGAHLGHHSKAQLAHPHGGGELDLRRPARRGVLSARFHSPAARFTSRTVTRPSAPLPSTSSTSTPSSSALRSAASVASCFSARR
jgi:hypothetical protein